MKKSISLVLLFLLAVCHQLIAQDGTGTGNVRHTVISNGIGLGGTIAVVASWSRNRSIAWAIVHGILSWLYVIYFVITRTSKDR